MRIPFLQSLVQIIQHLPLRFTAGVQKLLLSEPAENHTEKLFSTEKICKQIHWTQDLALMCLSSPLDKKLLPSNWSSSLITTTLQSKQRKEEFLPLALMRMFFNWMALAGITPHNTIIPSLQGGEKIAEWNFPHQPTTKCQAQGSTRPWVTRLKVTRLCLNSTQFKLEHSDQRIKGQTG